MYTVGAQTLLLTAVPAGQRGRAAGLFSGGFLVGAMPARPSAAWWRSGRCVRGGAGGMLMLALLPSLPGYLAGLAVSGLGSGLLDVAPSAMIGDLLAGPGGTLVASYQMAGDAGTVAGPVAAGYLVDRASYAAAFESAAALLGVAAVLAALAPPGGPRRAAGGPSPHPPGPPGPPHPPDPAPPGLTP
jgi:MFS family permease